MGCQCNALQLNWNDMCLHMLDMLWTFFSEQFHILKLSIRGGHIKCLSYITLSFGVKRTDQAKGLWLSRVGLVWTTNIVDAAKQTVQLVLCPGNRKYYKHPPDTCLTAIFWKNTVRLTVKYSIKITFSLKTRIHF